MIQVIRKVNTSKQGFTFRVTRIIEFTLLLLSVEANNNWKESPNSFRILSPSIERRRTVNSMIHVTRKVTSYFELFTLPVTRITEFTLPLLSIGAHNIWNELGDCVQLVLASTERSRRVKSMIQVTPKVNTSKQKFTFRVT